jgi:CBS-domain-containing membrane protein
LNCSGCNKNDAQALGAGSWLGGLLAITTLALISNWSHYGLVVASFGASTVLLLPR